LQREDIRLLRLGKTDHRGCRERQEHVRRGVPGERDGSAYLAEEIVVAGRAGCRALGLDVGLCLPFGKFQTRIRQRPQRRPQELDGDERRYRNAVNW
jgi:hypothetical protein